MKLNNRFIFGILSLVLAAVIAFVALPTIARQTNGKTEIVRITQPVLKGEQITGDNAEVVEVGGYNLPSNVAHSLDDVEGLYVTADLAAGDYILTSKVSTVPVSSDVALNDIPSGKVAISLTVKTLASGLSDKLQPNDIIRIYHSWKPRRKFLNCVLSRSSLLPIPTASMWTMQKNPLRTRSRSSPPPSQCWQVRSRRGSSPSWRMTAWPMWR